MVAVILHEKCLPDLIVAWVHPLSREWAYILRMIDLGLRLQRNWDVIVCDNLHRILRIQKDANNLSANGV